MLWIDSRSTAASEARKGRPSLNTLSFYVRGRSDLEITITVQKVTYTKLHLINIQ